MTQCALPCPDIVPKNVSDADLPGRLMFSAASLFRTKKFPPQKHKSITNRFKIINQKASNNRGKEVVIAAEKLTDF